MGSLGVWAFDPWPDTGNRGCIYQIYIPDTDTCTRGMYQITGIYSIETIPEAAKNWRIFRSRFSMFGSGAAVCSSDGRKHDKTRASNLRAETG